MSALKKASRESENLTSSEILGRFCRARDGQIRLALEPAYLDLLKKLGNPHKKLPSVIHVAGTNGKGSTCAFLRAMLEAAGYRVHVYTSPHLVRFHERIRIAGELISENELVEILNECERFADPGQVSDFEIATAVAFTAFGRHPADVCILEVGMGGRLDATNVIESAEASVITRLSYDHCKYLGDTLTAIAREKAGIMRAGTPCFTAMQDPESLTALETAATEKNTPLSVGSRDWRIASSANGFCFTDAKRTFDLLLPALPGPHQVGNAGLAIVALSALPFSIPQDAINRGLQTVEWPARLQKITGGKLARALPKDFELWLDGGHNDSAALALAAQMELWQQQNGRPLYLIFGMLATKDARTFLQPLAKYAAAARTVAIPDESLSSLPHELAHYTKEAGIKNVGPAKNIESALSDLARLPPGRILICGSLYLAGHVLKENGQRVTPER